jgi:hypothetical protein
MALLSPGERHAGLDLAGNRFKNMFEINRHSEAQREPQMQLHIGESLDSGFARTRWRAPE